MLHFVWRNKINTLFAVINIYEKNAFNATLSKRANIYDYMLF